MTPLSFCFQTRTCEEILAHIQTEIGRLEVEMKEREEKSQERDDIASAAQNCPSPPNISAKCKYSPFLVRLSNAIRAGFWTARLLLVFCTAFPDIRWHYKRWNCCYRWVFVRLSDRKIGGAQEAVRRLQSSLARKWGQSDDNFNHSTEFVQNKPTTRKGSTLDETGKNTILLSKSWLKTTWKWSHWSCVPLCGTWQQHSAQIFFNVERISFRFDTSSGHTYLFQADHDMSAVANDIVTSNPSYEWACYKSHQVRLFGLVICFCSLAK